MFTLARQVMQLVDKDIPEADAIARVAEVNNVSKSVVELDLDNYWGKAETIHVWLTQHIWLGDPDAFPSELK